jgi:chemotaxis protein methyltransferase WspC
MTLTPVTELLCERIGLAPESLGATRLSEVVGARMRALGLSAADYSSRLSADPLEFEALAADLTVPETWFFRGGDLFSFLARTIAGAARLRPPGTRFRILSVPCSTGEEPYSLALALLDCGVAPGSWQMDAADLGAAHVERARRGIYGEFSFRQTAPELRQRYFRPTAAGWELHPAVRELVHFRQGNLLDPFFLAGEGPFDLIFCRNLFIYLHTAARHRALQRLDAMLASGGWLCMGHAEPIEFLEPRFARVGPEGFFLYERRAPQPSSEPTQVPAFAHASGSAQRSLSPKRQRGSPAFAHASGSAGTSVGHKPECSPNPQPAPAAPPSENLIERARRQADRGQIDEAMATCRSAQSRGKTSADLYNLLGELHKARHEKQEARLCFEKALYLDSGQRDALTHLMLLCQEEGDLAQADRLRRRLERATSGGAP